MPRWELTAGNSRKGQRAGQEDPLRQRGRGPAAGTWVGGAGQTPAGPWGPRRNSGRGEAAPPPRLLGSHQTKVCRGSAHRTPGQRPSTESPKPRAVRKCHRCPETCREGRSSLGPRARSGHTVEREVGEPWALVCSCAGPGPLPGTEAGHWSQVWQTGHQRGAHGTLSPHHSGAAATLQLSPKTALTVRRGEVGTGEGGLPADFHGGGGVPERGWGLGATSQGRGQARKEAAGGLGSRLPLDPPTCPPGVRHCGESSGCGRGLSGHRMRSCPGRALGRRGSKVGGQGAGQRACGDAKAAQERGRTRRGEEGGAASQEPRPGPGLGFPTGTVRRLHWTCDSKLSLWVLSGVP